MIEFTRYKKNSLLGKIIISSVFLFKSLPALCASIPQEKGDSASMNIHITGTVVVTQTCEITDPINVEFNDVYIEEINNKTYKKDASYKVKCTPGANDKTINVTFSGLEEKYDPSLFSTDVSGLGIELMNDGKQISPGETTALYTDNSSQLSITLTKEDGVSLPEKEFNSVIILTSQLN